ncbi:MAG: hypothetical protein EA361_02285 [Bacteroidetes bacterium]|nr:MAG: hypothetical protein EA361_02285 [Bacteroidota bacterium]
MENNFRKTVISTILFLISIMVFSQKAYYFGPDAMVGVSDSVVIRLNDYEGTMQWQKSFDMDNWENIPDATRDTLLFVADTTTYFRAEVIAGYCDPFYSDTVHVGVYKKNSAVVIIDDYDVELLSDSTQLANGIYVYSQDVTGIIDIGSVLVSREGEGYIRIVTEINPQKDQTVILTEGGDLTDVIDEIDLQDYILITMSDSEKNVANARRVPLQISYLIPGARTDDSKSGFDLSGVNFTIDVPDPNDEELTHQITANITHGIILFEPLLERILNIGNSPPQVSQFGLIASGDINYELDVIIEAETGITAIEEEIHLITYTIGPVFFGLVPMYIDYTLTGVFSTAFDESGEVSFGFKSGYETQFGAFYDRDFSPQWTTIWQAEKKSHTDEFLMGDVQKNVFAGIGVENKFSTKIGGVSGPDFSAEPNLWSEFSISFSPPEWNSLLASGISGALDFVVTVIDETLNDFQTNLPAVSWIIYEAGDTLETTVPEVETLPAQIITATSALSGGYVINDGGSDVISRGVVWSTTENPTLDYNLGFTTDGDGTGEYESYVAGLIANTKYYIRSYATNGQGTGYGQQISFRTFVYGEGVTDIDGNFYQTVVINNFEWMAENLKTKKYSDSTNISNAAMGNGEELRSGAYYWYNDDEVTYKDAYGALYNWHAVNNSNGLCPAGWRVPTRAEWITLVDYVVLEGYLNSTFEGGAQDALKSCRQIDSPLGGDCATSEHPRWNFHSSHYGINAFGFDGLPGGYRTSGGSFEEMGDGSYLWTASQFGGDWSGSAFFVLLPGAGFISTTLNASKFEGMSVRCIRDVVPEIPTVSTLPASNIISNTADGGGIVHIDGFTPVTARGVVWSTTENPSLQNNQGLTNNGFGTGVFESLLSGLSSNTTYFYRAYATNMMGTSYGQQVSFTTTQDTGNLPHVTTHPVTNITNNSASSGGNVTTDGGTPVTARGVLWSALETPTVDSNHGFTANGEGTGEFVSDITDLSPYTTFYVRAYATNNAGIVYGQQETFTTPTSGNFGEGVTDIEENEYTTVFIGDREWMAENLKTTKYKNGINIPNITDGNDWVELTYGAYSWYNNDESFFKDTYGALYNWHAVNTGNLCPTGWKIPNKDEMVELVNYLIDQGYPNTDISGGAGNALKSCRQVNSPMDGDCETIDHPRFDSHSIHYGIDIFGFSGLPGGGRILTTGDFSHYGSFGRYWTSTENSSLSGWYFSLGFDRGDVFMSNNLLKTHGLSVRCLKEYIAHPTVTTASMSNVGQTTATGGGNVTSDGFGTVTARGIAYSTSPDPTISNNTVSAGSGTGPFAANITGLSPGTTYYLRAYATNSAGTAYGQQVNFTTTGGSSGQYSEGYIHCNPDNPTAVVDVITPITGRTWMDRNLGAWQVATSSADEAAYGDLHQWGRFADGHQCRTSPTTDTLSNSDQPGHGLFILSSNDLWDWRSPQNDNLWQGVNGVNNPCPHGYRLPTQAELHAERMSWSPNNAAGAFASPLKLTVAGSRNSTDGSLNSVGTVGRYMTSSVHGSNSFFLFITSTGAHISPSGRANGGSVRCLKNLGD